MESTGAFSHEEKRSIYNLVLEKYQDAVKDLQLQISSLQHSANEETKSSVGDKYETGRAMVQLEIEKLSGRLTTLQSDSGKITQANPTHPHDVVGHGSLVTTSMGTFYIIYNGGDVQLAGKRVTCISGQSPLGTALRGSRKNDSVVVNGRTFAVISVV